MMKGMPTKDVDEFFEKSRIHETYKKPDKGKMMKIVASHKSFQIDIVLMPSYKNISKFLLLVDVMSRKAFAYVLKSGEMRDVVDAYGKFLDEVGYVNSITGDNYFGSALFRKVNEVNNIKMYVDIAADDHIGGKGNRLGIIDRLVRSLKNYMTRYELVYGDKNWIGYLGDIVDMHNNLPHKALGGKTPNEVFEDDRMASEDYVDKVKYNDSVNTTFEVGDSVRVVGGKSIFGKERPVLDSKIYIIESKDGYKYKLEGLRRKVRATEMRKWDGVKPYAMEERPKTVRRVKRELKQIDNVPAGAVIKTSGIAYGLRQRKQQANPK